MAHDVAGTGLEVEQLRLNQFSFPDDILHVAVVEELARHALSLIEEDGIFNNLTDGEFFVVVDDSHVGGIGKGAIVVVEDALEFGEPEWGREYQWTSRRGMPTNRTETMTKRTNLQRLSLTGLISRRMH